LYRAPSSFTIAACRTAEETAIVTEEPQKAVQVNRKKGEEGADR
jgi:hypothetical protein